MAIITIARDGTGDYNCDGIDDQIEINQALNATSGGDTIYIKSGVYNTTNSIIIPINNLTLRGDGELTKIQTTTSILLDLSIASGTVVDNIYLYGSKNFSIFGLDNSTVSNCFFENCSGISALRLRDYNLIKQNYFSLNNTTQVIDIADYCTVSDNIIENNNSTAIRISDEFNVIKNNHIASNKIGIIVVFWENEIIGNLITSCNWGIVIGGESHDNKITGNEIISSNKDGMYITGDNNIISENVCKNNLSNGIYLLNDADNNDIAFNNIANNEGYEVNIATADCNNNSIHNNLIVGEINDNGTNTSIYDNTGEGFAEILRVDAPQQAYENQAIKISTNITNKGFDDNLFVKLIADGSELRQTNYTLKGDIWIPSFDLTMPNKDLNIEIQVGHEE